MKKILRIIFPPICTSCRKRIPNGVLCDICKSSIWIRKGFVYHQNRLPLAAASSYKIPAVRELVHALKYRKAKDVLEEIAEIIDKYLENLAKENIQNSLIIPIPLHRRKEGERGFNQSELIAEILKNKLGGELQKNNLVRTRRTTSQTKTKNYKERRANVVDCFGLKEPSIIAGRKIILVDDIFTSGATMMEAIKILEEGGADKITGFVIAKA